MKKTQSLLFAVLFLILAGCSAKSGLNTESKDQLYSEAAASYAPDMPQSAPAYDDAAKENSGYYNDYDSGASFTNTSSGLPESGRKLIRTADVQAQTKTFDDAMNEITELVALTGGYVDSSYISNGGYNDYRWEDSVRNASLSIRVPAERFDEFLNACGEFLHIVSKTTGTQDISDSYVDTQARLESLMMMEERLLNLLSKSEQLTDIIQLEQTLSSTRYEIERLNGTLRAWDGLVAYSTVNVKLSEVVELTEITEPVPGPKTLGERISASFSNTINGLITFGEGFLVFFFGTLPVLLILAALGLLVLIIVKASKKKQP